MRCRLFVCRLLCSMDTHHESRWQTMTAWVSLVKVALPLHHPVQARSLFPRPPLLLATSQPNIHVP
jgi:hypothetical protein